MARLLLHTVTIAADADTIYNALTTSQGLSSFWTADSHAEPKVGSIATFGFHGPKLELRVEELQPGKLVKWSSLGGFPEMGGHWEGTTITWEIVPATDGGHEVRFSHTGWADDVPPEILGAVNYSWGQIVGRLKKYAETGHPDPFIP